MPTIVPLHRDGHPIKTLDDWRKFAGPKGKERHWQDGRSAKELARAWTSFGPEPAAPQVLLDLFSSHPTFRDVTLTEGTPEDRIYFDQLRGEPRNADFTLIGRSSIGTVVISVEAKADESFGGTVASVVAAAIKRRSKRKASNGDKRAQSLVRFLFADDAPHKNAPYQLLTACAGALSLAEKRGAVAALVVVHEFANGKRANGPCHVSEEA